MYKPTIVIFKKPIDKAERAEIAKWLAKTIDLDLYLINDCPYMPNQGDTLFWTLDTGNDIKVKFFDTAPNEVEIIHRYRVKNAVEGLARWFAYRYNGRIKGEENE